MVPRNITKKIKNVTYSILSPKDILKQSVSKIITPEVYDKYGFPVESGLMDMRMGVIEPSLRCKTCSRSYKECEGHFGHIELSRPIINVLYINKIHELLKSTCSSCHRILLDEEKLKEKKEEFSFQRKKMTNSNFLKYAKKFLTEVSKTKQCPHCKTKQEPISLDKSSIFIFKEGTKKRLLATDIRFRFENIIDEDLELFNLIDDPSRMVNFYYVSYSTNFYEKYNNTSKWKKK